MIEVQIAGDEELLKIAQKHKSEVMTYFLKKYEPTLTRKAIQVVGPLAGDMVHDSFVQLNRYLAHFRSENEVVKYLYAYTKYNCEKYLKQCIVPEQKFYCSNPSEDPFFNNDPLPPGIVLKLVNRLPSQRKKIIIHLFWNGLSSTEVAVLLNLSRQTVINQKVRALKFLRKEVMKLF